MAKKTQFWANFDSGEGSCIRTGALPKKSKFTHNLGQILTFWGSHTDLLLPMRAKFGVLYTAIADPQFTLTCQISPRSFILSPSGGEKPPVFAIFWTSAFSGVAR